MDGGDGKKGVLKRSLLNVVVDVRTDGSTPVVLSILGNPSGIFSRREEDPHSDKEKDQDLTEGQDAINSSAA